MSDAECDTLDRADGPLPIGEMRAIVADLFEPRPRVFWTDFLLTILAGHITFELVYRVMIWFDGSPALWLSLQIPLFIINCLLYYRAAMFIHELTHLRDGEFRRFRLVWNALCGIPFLLPSFLYYPHLDHHRAHHYGTDRDAEYLPLGAQSRWSIVGYMLTSLVVPLLAVLRFVVLAPLSWFVPPLRRWLLVRGSTMLMDPSYSRPLDSKEVGRTIFLQELLCLLWCMGVTFVILVIEKGWMVPFLVQAYLTAVVVISLNSIRTLGTHRFTNAGEVMSFSDQVLDSYNYAQGWLAELWAPVGTRYHALHHLFPALPYHALPAAHRRLAAQLPADSRYHDASASGLVEALSILWRAAGDQREQHPPQTRVPSAS